jgi:hypothetical protein
MWKLFLRGSLFMQTGGQPFIPLLDMTFAVAYRFEVICNEGSNLSAVVGWASPTIIAADYAPHEPLSASDMDPAHATNRIPERTYR